jgi:hypothetical protein
MKGIVARLSFPVVQLGLILNVWSMRGRGISRISRDNTLFFIISQDTDMASLAEIYVQV